MTDVPVFYVQLLMPVGMDPDVVGAVSAKDFDGKIGFEISFYATEPIELLAPFALAAQEAARAYLIGERVGWYTHPVSEVSTKVITRAALEGFAAPDRLPSDWSAAES